MTWISSVKPDLGLPIRNFSRLGTSHSVVSLPHGHSGSWTEACILLNGSTPARVQCLASVRTCKENTVLKASWSNLEAAVVWIQMKIRDAEGCFLGQWFFCLSPLFLFILPISKQQHVTSGKLVKGHIAVALGGAQHEHRCCVLCRLMVSSDYPPWRHREAMGHPIYFSDS